MIGNNRTQRTKMPARVSNRPNLSQTKDEVPVVGDEAAVRGDGRRPQLPLGNCRGTYKDMYFGPPRNVRKRRRAARGSSPSWGLIAVGLRTGGPTAVGQRVSDKIVSQ
jgi:hypothetical protein